MRQLQTTQVFRLNADEARLKCNREKPCQNCTARDERISCRYKGSGNGTPAIRQDEHEDPMRQRLDHLEGLVKRLIAQRPETLPINAVGDQDSPGSRAASEKTAEASDISDVSHRVGTTVIDGTHSVYNGGDDWYDVLKEVSQLVSLSCSPSTRFIPWLYCVTNCIIDQQAEESLESYPR